MQSSTDPRPVVVAVDASDSARDAAAWAADLAADWSAPLHLVHVVPGDPQDRPLDPLPGWLTTLLDVAERAGARPCTAEAQPGDLATTIAARAVGARMVVLGSYGAGAVRGHAGGHHLPCRRRAGRLPGRRGARVGAPDRPTPQRARRRRRRRLGGGRRRAGVRRRPGRRRSDPGCSPCIAGRTSTPPRKEAPTAAGHRRCWPRQAAAALDEQLQPIVDRHPSLNVQRKLVDAPPLQALIEHAAGARMLVVGTRGRTGQTGILMGSTSLALVEFATCPVVVVHPRRAVAAGTAAVAGTAVRS